MGNSHGETNDVTERVNEKITAAKQQAHSIGIVGVYPPPYGGISVHVERLSHALNNLGINNTVYDGSEQQIDQSTPNGDQSTQTSPNGVQVVPVSNIERWCWQYVFRCKEQIVHNHFLRWQVRFTLSLLKLRGKRVVHTLHSFRHEGQYSWPMRWMIRFTGWLSDHFVVVNDEIKDKLIQLGIHERKISVIPAFIAPAELVSWTDIPTYITEFYERHNQVILANGGVGETYQGDDLYGFDLCVSLIEQFYKNQDQVSSQDQIPTEQRNIGLVYCITHIVNENQLVVLKERIKQQGLDEHILFVDEKLPLYPLLKQSALFVRPTASDGDAISIREALHYNIPVVASNVVTRPAGTVLFENRDGQDFFDKCDSVLSNPATTASELALNSNPDSDSATIKTTPNTQDVFLQQLLDVLL